MATLKEISELIRKDDAIIIDNQEEQQAALNSIDRGIRKFLAIQEGKRLDDLEDRRERKKIAAIAGVGGAAGAAGGGSDGGGFGFGLGGVAKIAGGLLALSQIPRLMRLTNRLLGKAFGTEKSGLLDSNKALRTELETLRKANAAEIKQLKTNARILQQDLDAARKVETDLRRQHAAQLKSKDATIRAQAENTKALLEEAETKRLKLQNDLQTARGDLDAARADLDASKKALKESKEAAKLRTNALRTRVADLQDTVDRLRNNAFQRQNVESFRAAEARMAGVVPGETVTYTNAAGEGRTGKVVADLGNKVQLQKGGATFAVDKNKLGPRITSATPLPGGLEDSVVRGKMGGKLFRGLGTAINLTDPVGMAEVGATTTSAIARKSGAATLATRSATFARFLSGPVGLALSFAITPSGISITQGLDGQLAVQIATFLNAIQSNKPLATIRDAKKKILSNPSFKDSTLLMDAFKIIYEKPYDVYPPKFTDGEHAQIEAIIQLIKLNEQELGAALKHYYGEDWEKFKKYHQARAEFFAGPQAEAARQEVLRIFGGSYAGKVPEGLMNAQLEARAQSYGLKASGLSSGALIPTQQKMARISQLEAGQLGGGGSGSVVAGNDFSQSTSVSNTSPIVTNGGGTVDQGDRWSSQMVLDH